MKEECRKYLSEQFGGDEAVINEIYAEYVTSTRTKIAEAKAQLAASEWVKLDRTAHAQKGNALAAGDQAMADLAISLRKASALQDASGAETLISGMADLAERL